MKRALFIAMPLLIALAWLVTMVLAVNSLPLAAQNALEDYVRFLNSSLNQDDSARYEIQTMARANQPWNLCSKLNCPTLGDSVVFQTDQRYSTPTPQPQTPVWNRYFDHNSSIPQADDRLPLPFPPQDVWCILLSDGTRDQLAFLALHNQEPHNTDWIIHQNPLGPLDESSLALLSDLGCSLGLEP